MQWYEKLPVPVPRNLCTACHGPSGCPSIYPSVRKDPFLSLSLSLSLFLFDRFAYVGENPFPMSSRIYSQPRRFPSWLYITRYRQSILVWVLRTPTCNLRNILYVRIFVCVATMQNTKNDKSVTCLASFFIRFIFERVISYCEMRRDILAFLFNQKNWLGSKAKHRRESKHFI